MKTPAISVIVPVYNVERYLAECLDSILAQTLRDIQIICVNDGSTDNSGTILEQYQKKDARIKVIHQENRGLSGARNAGMSAADGKYVGFVDSDDFVAPDMMETLYSLAERNHAEIAIGDLYLYDHNTKAISTYRDQALYERLNGTCTDLPQCPELIRQIGATDRIYLRSFLEENAAEFPVGLIYEDAAFTAQTLVRAKRVAVSSRKLYYYRKNAGESITDHEAANDRYKQSFLEIQPLMIEALDELGRPSQVYAEYLQYFIGHAFVHQMNAAEPKFFNRFFCGMRQLLTDESYALFSNQNPFKMKVYMFFLRHNCIITARGYFAFRRICRRILKRGKST